MSNITSDNLLSHSYARILDAAHSDYVVLDRSVEGRFELLDRDRLDLLQRMSTNDLMALKPGEGTATVLTTALARIIDRLIVYNRGETALAICGVGRTAAVRGWLQRHIFFQDKVKTRDVSSEWAQFGLFGAKADALAEQLAPGASSLALHHYIETTLNDLPLLIARTYPIRGAGYTLLTPATARDSFVAALQTLTHAEQSPVVDGDLAEAVYDALRIEAGIPLSGHELTEDYIPLEAGLWDAVSFKKGCYIGQEIIARMESRNKIARTLVQLRLSAAVPVGTPLYTADSMDRAVGTLTSVSVFPVGDQGVAALGYVKTDALESPLIALPEGGTPIRAERYSTAQR